MSKKIINHGILMLAGILLLVALVFAGAGAAYSGGDGTAANPYLISTYADLNAMSSDMINNGSYFKLTNNINCMGNQLRPIGSSSLPFTGNFNGAGYTISNATLVPANQMAGLFGYVRYSACIEGVTLSGINLSTDEALGAGGALAAAVFGESTIKNCHVVQSDIIGSNSESSENFYLGGLVGLFQDGNIAGCSAENCYVSGLKIELIGGLVGAVDSSTRDVNITDCSVSNCYVSTNRANCGGLVGYMVAGNNLTLIMARCSASNCYVVSTGSGGGLVGLAAVASFVNNMNITGCSASNCYVQGSYSVGGLIGYIHKDKMEASVVVQNSCVNNGVYSNSSSSRYDEALPGISPNTAYSRTGSVSAADGPNGEELFISVTGGPQTLTIGKYGIDYGYESAFVVEVTVVNDGHGSASASPTKCHAGDVITLTATPHDGYQFDTWGSSPHVDIVDNQFTMPGEDVLVTAHFVPQSTGEIPISTLADLKKIGDASAGYPLDGNYRLTADIDCGGLTLTPIGNYTHPFTGSFNGAGHTIRNFEIHEDTAYAGLFGHVNADGRISDVSVSRFSVSGNGYVGGLVGMINTSSGMISNCHAASGTVVSSIGYAGGLVGSATVVNMTGCGATGCYVEGSDYVGGLAGSVTATADMTACSASMCYVTGSANVGGIAGSVNAEMMGCLVSGCYVIGTTNVGSIAGYADTAKTISACSSLGCYVQGDGSVGGLIGSVDRSAGNICTGCIYGGSVETPTAPSAPANIVKVTSSTVVQNSGPNGMKTLLSSVFNATETRKITIGVYGLDYGYPGVAYHNHNTMEFMPLIVGSGALETGNYYLTGDLDISSRIAVADGAVVNFCFNGYHITLNGNEVTRTNAEDAFTFGAGSTFMAWDCTDNGMDHVHGTIVYDKVLNEVSGIGTGAVTLPAGNYTLTSDLQLGGQITVDGGVTVRLCLNGYNITAASETGIFVINGAGTVFYLADCKAKSGYLKGNGYGTGVRVNSGSKFIMTGGHISGYGSTSSYAVNIGVGATMEINGKPVIDNLVFTAEEERITVVGALETGAKIPMAISYGAAAGKNFATGWHSAWGSAGTYFKADPTYPSYVAWASSDGKIKFLQPSGVALIAGTTTNLTGDRIGYPDVASQDIMVKYSTLPLGVRVGINESRTTVLEIPQDTDTSQPFTLLVNGMELPVSILGWNVNTTGRYTVDDTFRWTQPSGKSHINESELSLSFSFSEQAKYVPMPEITYGSTHFIPDADDVVVKRNGTALVKGVDYTVEGNEIVLSDSMGMVPAGTYDYTYIGHRLGDINGDGLVDMLDTSLMTIALNDDYDLTDEGIVYANVEGSAKRQAPTLKNLVTLNNYLADHL